MPLRPLRLLSLPIAVTSHSFTSTLQLAAGRAWTQRYMAHSVKTPRKDGVHDPAVASSSRTCASRVVGQSGKTVRGKSCNAPRAANESSHSSIMYPVTIYPAHPAGGAAGNAVPIAHFDANEASVEFEASPLEVEAFHDLHGIPPETLSHLLPSVTPVSLHLDDKFNLPTPSSRTTLLRNIFYLINSRRPSTRYPAVLDYHSLYPHLHSTRSYNLLIEMALRHCYYGTVQNLFSNFRENALQRNLETYRLEIRWLIQTGHWDKAWNHVMEHKSDVCGLDGSIPFPIWLEFFRTPTCPRPRASTANEEKSFDVNGITNDFERLESIARLRARQRLLYEHRPTSFPPLAQLSPYAITNIIRLMIQIGQQGPALSLTKAYFKALPRLLTENKAMRCVNVIHCHLISSKRKNGLSRFQDIQKTLISLLRLHPALRPTSQTLYLILAPLVRTKRCGTIAWDTLQAFKVRWGIQVEDQRVRRRVGQLAIKEGRLDIVDKISMAEEVSDSFRKRSLLERRLVGGMEWVPRRLSVRFPMRKLYPKNGRELRFWRRLKARVDHKTSRHVRIQDSKVFIS